MPRNCVTPFLAKPSTGPSEVATGAALAPATSPHSNASTIPTLRIFASLLLLALDVGDDLPDLVHRHLVFPGRHAARRAVGDGVIDLARLAAILPAGVGEVRSHATGQIIGMTS